MVSPWQYALGMVVYVDVRSPGMKLPLFHPIKYAGLRFGQMLGVPMAVYWLAPPLVPHTLLATQLGAAILGLPAFLAVYHTHWQKSKYVALRRAAPAGRRVVGRITPTRATPLQPTPQRPRLQPLFGSPGRTAAIALELLQASGRRAVAAKARTQPLSPPPPSPPRWPSSASNRV